MEDEIAEMKKLINDLITEVNLLKTQNAKIESAQKILRTEALRVKTMSDKYLPTIGDMMGINGRKGA
jgi:hypothetical protein